MPDRLLPTDVDRLLKAANDLPKPLPHWAKRTLASLTLLAALGFFALLTANLIHTASVGDEVAADQRANTQALCALRGDLQTRLAAGQAFLEKHPQGVLGISPATMASGISNERATIRALSVITCPR